jgi:hypothetical protein
MLGMSLNVETKGINPTFQNDYVTQSSAATILLPFNCFCLHIFFEVVFHLKIIEVVLHLEKIEVLCLGADQESIFSDRKDRGLEQLECIY